MQSCGDVAVKEVAEQGRLIDLDLARCNVTTASGSSSGSDLGPLLPRWVAVYRDQVEAF